MKRKILFLFFIVVVLISGCARTVEERELEQFLRVWPRVRLFYMNKVVIIGREGFLNPSLVTLLHEDLRTNEVFRGACLSEFSSVDEYIHTFSNVSIHYAFLAFQESLQGRSPVVLMREIEDVLVKSENDSSPQAKQKRMMASLLYERLKQYHELESQVSTNWLKAVLRYARELNEVYAGLVDKKD